MSKKHKFFDFDSTLVEHHYPFDAGQEEDEYMDSPESLDFTFKLKPEILTEYQKAVDEGSKRILLTNRSYKVGNEIIKLLSDLGVTFDDHLFREDDRSKGNRMVNYLDECHHYGKPDEVHFWDDKSKHIKDVKRISVLYDDIDFYLNKVD